MVIKIKLQVEGVHQWLAAPQEVSYLANLHRHIFHIEVEKTVEHNDRDIEIIMFKRQVDMYLIETYFDMDYSLCNFGEMSCEMIAKQIGLEFNAKRVQVLEDNENGAIWTA